MINRCTIILYSLIFVLVAMPIYAQSSGAGAAGLIVIPTSIKFKPKSRHAHVTIHNPGLHTGHYKLKLIDFIMTEDGFIREAKEEEKYALSLTKHTKTLPREITLEGQESQAIFMLAKGMEEAVDGEYRAHLQIIMIQKDRALTSRSLNPTDFNVTIENRRVINIPVLMIKGEVSYEIAIDKVVYIPKGQVIANVDEDGDLDEEVIETDRLRVYLHRTGSGSADGVLLVNYKRNNKITTISDHQTVNIYSPLEKRYHEIELTDKQGEMIAPLDGVFEITYKDSAKSEQSKAKATLTPELLILK